jgi:acyl-CoA thioester hydrolase
MVSRAHPHTRRDYAAFTHITTRWADNDIYGHMNNAVHYQLFDTTVNTHLMQIGLLDPANSETVFLVVDTGCTYFAEMRFPDTITAGLRVAHLGTSSVRYQIALFTNDDDSAAAQGHFTHVHVARSDRRPRPLTPPTRQALEALHK